MQKIIYIPVKKTSDIVKAGTTLGIDEMFIAMNETKAQKNEQPIKAVLGRKHIRFKKPLIQWEQTYTKLNL